MKIRFISRLLAILIFLPLFLFYYISPAFSQSGCQKIYDKKLTRLKHQLSSERRQIEKDFVRNKEALKKRREELKAKFRALDNIFDPASSLRFQCDAFKDKIDKYNFEMDFARRTLDTASEEYDKKTAPLKEGLKKTLKQWKDCLAKLEAKRKESASFRQRLEEKNRALNKLTDTTAQISDLEQEKKKTLKRLNKDYEREKEWLQTQRNYCKKNGEWPVETASCLSKSCADNLKTVLQALQHNLQDKRKLKKQLHKMQRRLDSQWDEVAAEMNDKMKSAEGSVEGAVGRLMGNFIVAFAQDRVDDLIGLGFEKVSTRVFKKGTEKVIKTVGEKGEKTLEKAAGTSIRKSVQKLTLKALKKLPSKTNAILGGLDKLSESGGAGAYRISDKQPAIERIGRKTLLGHHPVAVITEEVLKGNQVRLNPIKLSKFKKMFPSLAELDETYRKIFGLIKQLNALSAEEEGLWQKLIKASACIKPQCNLKPGASRESGIGITQKDLDSAKNRAFGKRQDQFTFYSSKEQLADMATGLHCDLCKTLQILKEVNEVSSSTRDNIQTLNTLIMRNQKTVLSLNFDLYKILTRPGALKGALWGYYDYLSTAMTFLPNGGSAVAFAEGIVGVADQYIKEGPAHNTWANIKRVSVIQASNAWLLDKWTRFGNNLNAFQERIIQRILLGNCLEKLCPEDKVDQTPPPAVSPKDITISGKEKEKKEPGEAPVNAISLLRSKNAQKIITENDYLPVNELIDLSGCWIPWGSSIGDKISISQNGRHVVATVKFEGEMDFTVVFTGEFNPPDIELVSTDIWKHRSWFNYSLTTDDAEITLLSKAKPEVLIRMKAWIASSEVSDWGFGVRNSHGIDINLYLGGYVLDSTLFPTVDSNYKTVLKKSSTNILGFDEILPPFYRFRDKRYEIEEKYEDTEAPDVGPWSFYMQTWEKMPKLSEYSLNSITVIDEDSQPVEKLEAGDKFWVKATSLFGCPGIRDHFEVNISPEDNPDLVTRVMLEETGPDTLEFRSPAKGVPVASVFEKKEKEEDRNKAKEPLKAKEESGAEKSKKPEKRSAKKDKKAVSGSKEKQEIIEVGARGGKKKAGLRAALNRSKTELIAEKKRLEKELKNRKKTLNNLGQAKALYIRHYSMQSFPHNKGGSKGGVRKIARLEITQNPELSTQEFKLEKTESVLFMRKAKEHLNKEIGETETDIKRIMKELEGLN